MDASPAPREPLARPRRAVAAAILLAVVLLVALGMGPGVDPAAAARLVPVGDAFESPVYVTAPSEDRKRLFVVERGGTIRVVREGTQLERPFLRIPGGVSTGGERGLLSMAFAPNYAQNRRFYVFYTDPNDGDLRIDEFKRSRNKPNRANRKSRRRVLAIEHSQHSNHNGGQLQFGPDGLLYISTGDGGGAGDPDGNAQDIRSLLGKLLRIDPRPRNGKPYRIPRDNPFVGRTGANEIFAFGLRNPWRFSFDRRNGNLAIGDVGQSEVEEVDFRRHDQPAGPNFGWSCFEGSDPYNGGESCLAPGSAHVPPVLERRHSTGDCSITGGYVARHRSLGDLRGRYVYGDFCVGKLRSAKLRVSGAVDDGLVGVEVGDFRLVSFGEDARGRLYVVSNPGGVGTGRIYRLRG